MTTLHIGGDRVARELALGTLDLAALSEAHRVPDVSELLPDRAGVAVRLSALAELAGAAHDARFVHVVSEDESFAANLPAERALRDALVLYELDGAPLPAKLGGPFRLLLVDGEECSVNVKFLGRVDFCDEPGEHTARCSSE